MLSKIRVIGIALMLFGLSGCGTFGGLQKLEEDIRQGKPDAFAVCATVDVVSTGLFLTSGTGMYELNPLVNAFRIGALGHVAGVLVPSIGLSVLTYYALKKLNEPVITSTVAGLTCLSGGRNLFQVIKFTFY